MHPLGLAPFRPHVIGDAGRREVWRAHFSHNITFMAIECDPHAARKIDKSYYDL